jgi:DNA-binding response OmpR family regulator
MPTVATGRAPRAVILLMEDDPGLRRSLMRILELDGFQVLEAGDGQEARRVAGDADRVDLLIADLVLPGIGGREVANLLQAEHPEMRVLFTSGFVGSDRVLRELTGAGYRVLRKPYQVPDFREAVRAALAG